MNGQFSRSVASASVLKACDPSKIRIPKPEGDEVDFETQVEIPPFEEQDEFEKKYWAIRKRTNLPKAYWNMAWIHVSSIICMCIYIGF